MQVHNSVQIGVGRFAFCFIGLFLLCNGFIAADELDILSPYGVCSHLAGGEEHNQMPRNLRVMREAGIRHARADFSWGGVERSEGNWHFDHLDKVVQTAENEGISILPILNYDVRWATPAYKFLPQWTTYVRNVVTRYKDKLRYWEVWNEPDLQGFWKDKPDGGNYAILLKATYNAIKEIDPALVVVYGGMSGVPFKFFEDSLKAGAGNYFDIINIHPYRAGLTSIPMTERFVTDIQEFNTLLSKYQIHGKPVWITEMGWSTPPNLGEDNQRIISGALAILYPDGIKGSVALLTDPAFEPSQSWRVSSYISALPKETKTEMIRLADLAKLNPSKQNVLILPPGETFPSNHFDTIVNYVKAGGTLILTSGVPLYYTVKQENGIWVKGDNASEEFRKKLRIGWKAWWTVQGTPKETPLRLTPEAVAVLPGYFPITNGSRFLTSTELKSGDKFVPLLASKSDDDDATAACIYDFNSDFRGAVVVSTVGGGIGDNISTEPDQGVFLPQAYLISFSAGVDRYYWYEFQSPEIDQNDKESFFGMVHRDLSPKSGYVALKTLTRARPSGSVQGSEWQSGEDCVIRWTRPDGRIGWAIWTPIGECERSIQITGTVDEAFDYLGEGVKEIDPKQWTITLTNKILYLIGPTDIKIK